MKTIELDSVGNIVIHNGSLSILSGIDALIQRVENKFLMYRGEHHLDTSAGSPWIQDILKRPANIPAAESMVRKTIMSVEGVVSVSSISINYDKNTRVAYIRFSASTIYGTLSKEVQV